MVRQFVMDPVKDPKTFRRVNVIVQSHLHGRFSNLQFPKVTSKSAAEPYYRGGDNDYAKRIDREVLRFHYLPSNA
jgi:hypothetical protein